MNKLIKIQLLGLLLSLITACGSVPIQEQPNTAEYAPILVPSQSSEPYTAGGLFSAQVGMNLYIDRRAYRAGDIITVSLNERTVSSKSAETKIEKDANVNFGADTVLGLSLIHI